MADYKVTDTELISIANAIRTKGGTSAQLEFPTGFVSAVNAIPTGGGDGYTESGLLVRYDGINNTGSGHDGTASTWKNLAAEDAYDLTLNGQTWGEDGLVFSGNNGIRAGAFFTAPFQTIEAVFRIDSLGVSGWTNPFNTVTLETAAVQTGVSITRRGNTELSITGYNHSSTQLYCDSGIIGEFGTLYYMAGVVDKTSLKCYINGQLKNTISLQSALSSQRMGINMGRSGSSSLEATFNGIIKHAAIYTKGLSAEEIASNYAYLKNRYNLP